MKKNSGISFNKARGSERGIYIDKAAGFISNSHWLAHVEVFDEGVSLLKLKSNAQFNIKPFPKAISSFDPDGRTEFRRTPLVWDDGVCFVVAEGEYAGVRRWFNKKYVETFNIHVLYGDPTKDEADNSATGVVLAEGALREDGTPADDHPWTVLLMAHAPPEEEEPLAGLVLRDGEQAANAPDVSAAFNMQPDGKKFACYCKLCCGVRIVDGNPGANGKATAVDTGRMNGDAGSNRPRGMSSRQAVAAALPDPEAVAAEFDESAAVESEITKIVRTASNSGASVVGHPPPGRSRPSNGRTPPAKTHGTGVCLNTDCLASQCLAARLPPDSDRNQCQYSASGEHCVAAVEKVSQGHGSSVYCVNHDAPDDGVPHNDPPAKPAPKAGRFGGTANGNARPASRKRSSL